MGVTLKPRLRLVRGFWHCSSVDAGGLGRTPAEAYAEWLAFLGLRP